MPSDFPMAGCAFADRVDAVVIGGVLGEERADDVGLFHGAVEAGLSQVIAQGSEGNCGQDQKSSESKEEFRPSEAGLA